MTVAYRIFVSSPTDVAEERARARRVIERLSVEFAGQAELEAVLWERRAYSARADFQAQIDATASCDVVVGILWARIGSPLDPALYARRDGSHWESGTAFEIETALEAGRGGGGRPEVALFVKRAPVPLDPRAPETDRLEQQRQLSRLQAALRRWTLTEAGHFKAASNPFVAPDEFESGLERFLRGWLAAKGHSPRGPRWDVARRGSPYPRLEPYDAGRREVFFGRDGARARCLELLREAAGRGCAFLLILGASGAGKSSLARAGVLPDLAMPGTLAGVDGWRVAVLRPGPEPLAALAGALFEAVPELGASDAPTPAAWAAAVAAAPDVAAGSVAAALDRAGAAARPAARLRLALLVDQLEEAFEDEAPRTAPLLAVLDRLARGGAASIVGTLRSDRYAVLQAEPLLRLKLDGALYDLPLAGRAEYAAILRSSSRAVGLTYQRQADGGDLADKIEEDLGSFPALPLLQVALAELFEDRDRASNELTFAAYKTMGGLPGAIQRRAEAVLEGVDEDARSELPALLLQLTGGVTSEGGVVSRPVPARDVRKKPARARLLAVLDEGRLLLTDGDIVRVAHDALLRHWPRAKEILDPDRIRAKLRLEDALGAYERSGLARRHLLPPGPQLQTGRELLHAYGPALSADLREFVQRSLAADRIRRWGFGIAGAAILAVVSGLGLLAERQRRAAETSRQAEQAAREQADIQRGLAEQRALEAQRLAVSRDEILGGLSRIATRRDGIPDDVLFLLYAARSGLSLATLSLMAEFEAPRTIYERLGSTPRYEARAGLVLGIEYSLRFVTAGQFRADWSGVLNEGDLNFLAGFVGLDRTPSDAEKARLSEIQVSYTDAIRVFGATLPRVVELVRRIFPNADELHPDSLGALVSLVYNRGSAMSGERGREMRAIAEFMRSRRFFEIPGKIREMNRLWPQSSSLQRRREAEAVLFEQGLGKSAQR